MTLSIVFDYGRMYIHCVFGFVYLFFVLLFQVPVPTLQALELATLSRYFSAMSDVLALKPI